MIRLFISEWDERYDWLQTTAEHDIVWSMWDGDHGELFFYVYTWIEYDSFMRNLTSWPMPFWLVLLTEHTCIRSSTATRRTRSTAAWLRDNCTRLVASLQQIVDASKFPTLDGQFTQHSPCTILLWQIEIFKNQNHMFLWNFLDFV